ncbi:hypothetical protein FCULG_00005827 [Fusarium culmorum]|uniref:NmrA-like domain-containing protein n=1 Tax=Fusarium culmorum TaxID=5516 RepID=A0A2T4GX99_FUSCU|nr:hypothetical protein FCULG_00005827 [Fusarium culmorum]
MTSPKQGRKIAIIGASGNVGAPTVKALLAQGIHSITAVQRLGAASKFPPNGLDAATSPYHHLVEQNQLLQDKKKIRDLISELGVASWISVTVGPFLDMNMKSGLWGIDVENRKATILDGNVGRVSASGLTHTGQAIAAVLTLPEEALSQGCVQRAMGTMEEGWSVEYQDIHDALKDLEAKIEQQDGNAPFVKFFLSHFQEGSGGDLRHKVNPDELNKLYELGLEDQALEDVIEASV